MGRPKPRNHRMALLISALMICALGYSFAADDSEIVVFNGATLIDGNGGEPVSRAAVVIQGDRILYAGPKDEIEIPTTSTVYDVRGLTILPGFFNTHVHEVSFTNGTESVLELSRLEAWAWGGVTTLRDVTSPRSALLRFKQAESVHDDPSFPRLLMSGPCVEVPGGRAEVYNRFII